MSSSFSFACRYGNDRERPSSAVGRQCAEELADSRRRRGVLIRPGIVHGAGGGIPAMLVDWARQAGIGRYVGDPLVRWPMVHVDDLADLVILALELAEPVRSCTASLGPPYQSPPSAPRAGRRKGPQPDLGESFAAALALDQEVVAGAARALGWAPSRPDAVTDLANGSYRLPEPVS